jgi:hypothetical protein
VLLNAFVDFHSAQLPLLLVSGLIFGLHYITHVSAILIDPAGQILKGQ